MLKRFDLGSEAITYVRHSLSQGFTLSKLLLRLPLEGGKLFTYLPSDVDTNSAQDLQHDPAFSHWGTDDSIRMAASFVASYLAGKVGRYALVEDIAKPGDSCLKESIEDQYVIYQSEVYDFLSSKDVSLEVIRTTLSKGRQYPFVGVLTDITGRAPLRNRQQVTLDTLEIHACNAQHILVGAYDETAHVIWSKVRVV